MDPATVALISALVREVGVPVARLIASAVRRSGHPQVADALEAEAAAALGRSDVTLGDVVADARREQGKA